MKGCYSVRCRYPALREDPLLPTTVMSPRSREAKSGPKAQQRITVEYNYASNEDEQVIFEQID